MSTLFYTDTDSVGYSTFLSNTNMKLDREKNDNRIQIHPFIIHIKNEYGYPY
jgi:hypothetical protein